MQKRYFSVLMLVVVALFGFGASCKNSVSTEDKTIAKNVDGITVMFYNVENLFDIEDDPAIQDEDFTPEGKLKWTAERYKTKLSRLAQTIDTIPGSLPEIIGLCEIENKMVLKDLVSQSKLRSAGYSIIHKDSPDERGIETAMLYNPSVVKVNTYRYIAVNLPKEDDKTREILYVDTEINGEHLHLFINHWPSRSGGQLESEPNRLAAATILRTEMDKIRATDMNAKILVMGDFNDYPDNKSIVEVVGAEGNLNGSYFNFMTDDQKRHEGSYYYKNEWTVLDQFIQQLIWSMAIKV